LKPWSLTTGITITDLAQDRYNFSSPLCINRENRFVIYLSITVFLLVYLCIDTSFPAVSRFPLVHVENNHQHTCLWAKLTHLFPGDSEFGEEDNSGCESEGEPSNGSTAIAQAADQGNGPILLVSESLDSFTSLSHLNIEFY
jgi:hypothetical protein